MQISLLRRICVFFSLVIASISASGQETTESDPPAAPDAPADTSDTGTPPASPTPPSSSANPPVPGAGLGPLAPGAQGAAGGQAPAAGPLGPGPLAPGAGGPSDAGGPAPSSGPALPEGYVPPASPPAIMTELPKPRRTDEEMKAADNKIRTAARRGINNILLTGDPSPENIQLLKDWSQLSVDKMAAGKTPQEITAEGNQIFTALRSAGSTQSNRNRQRDFREALCAALTTELGDVLLTSNIYVRARAAALLGELNLREAPIQGNGSAVAYNPAIGPLVDVIEQEHDDPQTARALEAVKITAATAIIRLSHDTEAFDVNLRYRAAEVMVKELNKTGTNYWYQIRLIEALTALQLDVDQQRNPIIITAFQEVISNNKRNPEVRATAAKCLSRTPIPAGQFDPAKATTDIVTMAREIALDYNRNPKGRGWTFAFYDMLLIFELAPEEDPDNLENNALLRQASLPAPYQAAQQQLTPVIDFVLSQKGSLDDRKPIPTELLGPLNQPANAQAGN